MKYVKDKKRKRFVCIIVVLSVLLAMMLALLIWLEFGSGPNGNNTTDLETSADVQDLPSGNSEPATIATDAEEENQTTEPADTAIYNNGEIHTPYLTLYYDDALADHLSIVNTKSEPYTLAFYALLDGRTAQRIFDVYLGEGADGNLGIVQTEHGNIPIGMTIYTFTPDDSWTEDEVNTILAMQDVINDMIEQLPLVESYASYEGPVISTVTPETNVTNLMTFSTPYCTLQYPATWKEYVLVEQMEEDVHKVMFYGQLEGREKKLIFSIIFGGDEGEQLGIVTNDQDETVPVNVLMEELILTGWSDEDAATIYAMQEAVNQLIAELPLE